MNIRTQIVCGALGAVLAGGSAGYVASAAHPGSVGPRGATGAVGATGNQGIPGDAGKDGSSQHLTPEAVCTDLGFVVVVNGPRWYCEVPYGNLTTPPHS